MENVAKREEKEEKKEKEEKEDKGKGSMFENITGVRKEETKKEK